MDKKNFEFKKLCPFKWGIYNNFPFLDYDFDQLTEWGILQKLGEDINIIAEKLNLSGEQIETLTDAFNELKDYINTYFENLDVQDEINNKLNEMAESGELAEIINQYIDTELKFIFPKFWANQYSGDCNLIKYKEKTILVDCYSDTAWQDVKAMLDSNYVSHIDYMIITHYHADHVGNFENLIINHYIDTETKVFLPAPVSFYGNEPTYYTNICIQNNLDYSIPSENQILQIDDLFNIKFFNCDTTILNNYYNDSSANNIKINNCSTVLLFTYQNNQVLFVGDCHKKALKRIKDNNFINGKLEIYKIGHHGIDEETDVEFLENISPKYAIQTSGIEHAQINEFGISADASILEQLGTTVYCCHKQNNYIEILLNGKTSFVKSGKAGIVSTSYPTIEYYVDINATSNNIQDGTEQYPFREISQAIGNLGNIPNSNVIIHVKNGYYADSINYGSDDSSSYIKNTVSILRNHNISIYGENKTSTIINGLRLINSNLAIYNCTIDTNNHNEAIYLNNSTLDIHDCFITSSTNEQNNKNATYIRKSRAYFDSCLFNYCNIGINNIDGSIVTMRYCNFGNNVIVPIFNRGHVREWGTNQNNDLPFNRKDYNKLINNETGYSPILIYAGEPEFLNTEIPLNVDVTKLNAIKIDYLDDGGILSSTGILDLSHNNRHWINLNEIKLIGNDLSIYGTCVQFKEGKMFYQTSIRKTTNINNNNTQYTTDRQLSVIKIYGYMIDYYDLT